QDQSDADPANPELVLTSRKVPSPLLRYSTFGPQFARNKSGKPSLFTSPTVTPWQKPRKPTHARRVTSSKVPSRWLRYNRLPGERSGASKGRLRVVARYRSSQPSWS